MESLCEEVDIDPWGLGYKIVMRKLGALSTNGIHEADVMETIVKTLFPTHPPREEYGEARDLGEIAPFNEEELAEAASSLANRKAPGPDGIPAEVLKVMARVCPQLLLNMYNKCLKEGIFPKQWTIQKLVLINKGKGDPNSPSSYRPLCMLDTAGKLLEKLLKARLQSVIQVAGDLSSRQYGFRKGRSTVDAVQEVVAAVGAAQRGNHHSRRIALLATLDVKNAFNSASWNNMLKALHQKFKVPHYLLHIVNNYLKERVLLYDTRDRP